MKIHKRELKDSIDYLQFAHDCLVKQVDQGLYDTDISDSWAGTVKELKSENNRRDMMSLKISVKQLDAKIDKLSDNFDLLMEYLNVEIVNAGKQVKKKEDSNEDNKK